MQLAVYTKGKELNLTTAQGKNALGSIYQDQVVSSWMGQTALIQLQVAGWDTSLPSLYLQNAEGGKEMFMWFVAALFWGANLPLLTAGSTPVLKSPSTADTSSAPTQLWEPRAFRVNGAAEPHAD